MNRDTHIVLGDELIEAGKRFRIALWIGGDRANAELFRELKNPSVRGMIVGESIDALSGDFQACRPCELASLHDLLIARGRREMTSSGKFDIVHAHALQMPDGLGQRILAQRNRLHSHGEAAPFVVFVRGGRHSSAIKPGRGGNGRNGEKPATGEAGVHYFDFRTTKDRPGRSRLPSETKGWSPKLTITRSPVSQSVYCTRR